MPRRRTVLPGETEQEMLAHADGMLARVKPGGDLYKRVLAAMDHKLLMYRDHGRRMGWCSYCLSRFDLEEAEDENARTSPEDDINFSEILHSEFREAEIQAGYDMYRMLYEVSPRPYAQIMNPEHAARRKRVHTNGSAWTEYAQGEVLLSPGRYFQSEDPYELPHRTRYSEGMYTYCPKCHMAVRIGYAGKVGRQKYTWNMYADQLRRAAGDKPRIVYLWGRSSLEPDNTLVCLGIACSIYWPAVHCIDSLPDEHRTFIDTVPDTVCIIRQGAGGTQWYTGGRYWNGNASKWIRASKVSGGVIGSLDPEIDYGTIDGTFTGKQKWIRDLFMQNVGSANMIAEVNRCLKYPCIEMMYKRGWSELAMRTAGGAYSHVNVAAKTVPQLLRISKERYQQIRSARETLDVRMLNAIQEVDEQIPGNHFRLDELLAISRYATNSYAWRQRLPNGIDKERTARYLAKKTVLAHDWVDYLDMAKDLDMPLDERSMYPKNFKQEHDKLTERIRIRNADMLQKKIDKFLPKYRKLYGWKDCGLIMAPHESIGSLIHEGNVQHICIGNYGESYANGKTILCTIRLQETPEVPLFDVEIRKGTTDIVQCRGAHNDYGKDENGISRAEWRRSWDPRLESFFSGWKKHYNRVARRMA